MNVRRISNLLFFVGLLLSNSLALAQKKTIAQADELYKQKQYNVAIDAYQALVTKENQSVIFAKIADCYIGLENPVDAQNYYEKAIKFGQIKSYQLLNYGNALKMNFKFTDARRIYYEYSRKEPTDKNAKRLANSCQMFLDNMKGGNCSAISSQKNCITIDASLSVDEEIPNLVYQWEFENGDKAEGTSVHYCFAVAGKHKIKLNTYDRDKKNSLKTDTTLYVLIEGIPITFSSQSTATINDLLTFNAAQSIIDDATITDYFWDFGDGTYSLGVEATHKFNAKGSYIVKLVITGQSNDGKQDIIYCGYKKMDIGAEESYKEKTLLDVLREEASEREKNKDKDKKNKYPKNK